MVSMTIKQFMQYERNEITINDIKRLNRKKLSKKQVMNILAFSIALINITTNAYAGTVEASVKVNQMGMQLLEMVRTIGYWLCIICGATDILKSALHGMSKDAWKIFVKYFVVFATLYALPFAFDFIREAFE